MAVKIKAKDENIEEQIEALTGDYIETFKEADKIRDKIKKLEKDKILKHEKDLKAKLEKLLDELLGTDDDATIEVDTGILEVSEKAIKRQISDLDKIKKYLGNETFMELAKVSLGDLDKHLTQEQLDETVSSTREGKRTLKVVVS